MVRFAQFSRSTAVANLALGEGGDDQPGAVATTDKVRAAHGSHRVDLVRGRVCGVGLHIAGSKDGGEPVSVSVVMPASVSVFSTPTYGCSVHSICICGSV